MIVPARPLDDDELLRFSADHPGWHIEREPDGSLDVSPTAAYGVVIDPERRTVEEFGTRPDGLALDFDRIIAAGDGSR
jgi:hypothetical protein